jgi:hypothetical protein
MSCATKIDHSRTTGPTPLGLIAREAKRLIGEGPHQPVKDPRSAEYQNNIIPNVLADSEHTDPEHVWGDEGPVNGSGES